MTQRHQHPYIYFFYSNQDRNNLNVHQQMNTNKMWYICTIEYYSSIKKRKSCYFQQDRQTLNQPWGSDGKESVCNVGDLGLIPGSGICPGKGHGNPLQYSCLENSTDRGAHGVTKSHTGLND